MSAGEDRRHGIGVRGALGRLQRLFRHEKDEARREQSPGGAAGMSPQSAACSSHLRTASFHPAGPGSGAVQWFGSDSTSAGSGCR